MTALHYREIGELPALFAAGETSPLALTRAMLDRIEALEPRLHSYALVLRESALAEAAPGPNSEAYVCGPPAMVERSVELLTGFGLAADAIRFESFRRSS